MLHSMGHAGHFILVGEVAHIDIQGCASLVGLAVVDEEHLQLVREEYDTIGSVI